jgi:hypothetical protein
MWQLAIRVSGIFIGGTVYMEREKNKLADDQRRELSVGKGTDTITSNKHTLDLPFLYLLQCYWEILVQEKSPGSECVRRIS